MCCIVPHQIRRPIGTTFELLIPALAIIVIVGIR